MAEYDVYIMDKEGTKHPLFTMNQDEMDRLMSVDIWQMKFGEHLHNKKLQGFPRRPVSRSNYYWPIVKYLKENGETTHSKLCSRGFNPAELSLIHLRSKYVKKIGKGSDAIYALTQKGENYYSLYLYGFTNERILRLIEAIKEGSFRTKEDFFEGLTDLYIEQLCIMLRKYIDKGMITDIGYKSELYKQKYYRYTFFPIEQFEQECAEVVC